MSRRIRCRSATVASERFHHPYGNGLTDTQACRSGVQEPADHSPEPRQTQPGTEPVQKPTRNEDQQSILASIQKAAALYHLPAALIQAVIKAESGFQVRAVSPAGAQGLMQLMPDTAKDLGVNDPFDIDENIHAGARYLRNMLDRFNGDIRLALGAYNAGPATVLRHNGHVPYKETQAYVRRVLRYAGELALSQA
jgi:soluble lytic murein transglycosylase-like protein